MPESDIPPLAVFEENARLLAVQESLTATRGDIRRLAKTLRKEYIADMPSWDPHAVYDTRILGIVTDATPRDAFREITTNDRAAARRLGLTAA